jgi:hypothetical protein
MMYAAGDPARQALLGGRPVAVIGSSNMDIRSFASISRFGARRPDVVRRVREVEGRGSAIEGDPGRVAPADLSGTSATSCG